MAKILCDNCGKMYSEENGRIKKIYDLDVCYVCGGYEPVVEEVEKADVVE